MYGAAVPLPGEDPRGAVRRHWGCYGTEAVHSADDGGPVPPEWVVPVEEDDGTV